jgi:hypothetical protein
VTIVEEACGDGTKNYSAVVQHINDLIAWLKGYQQGDSPPEEKSKPDTFISILEAAARKFTK